MAQNVLLGGIVQIPLPDRASLQIAQTPMQCADGASISEEFDALTDLTRATERENQSQVARARSGWLRHGVALLPRIALVAATGWVFFLLWRVGVWQVLNAVGRVGWGMIAIVVLPVGGLALHTLGWAVLLPSHQRPSPLKAFSVYVASQAGNELGGGVLGETVKLLIAPPKDRADATAALLVDNATALASTLGFGALALVLLGLPDVNLPWEVVTVASIVVLLCLAAAGVGGRMAHRALGVVREQGRRVAGAISTLLRRSPARVATSFIAHALGKAWIVVEFAVALALIGGVPVEQALVLGPAAVLATIVGAPIPAKVGVMEASALWTAQAHAEWVPTLLAVVLLRRVRSLLWTALGVYLTSGLVRSAAELHDAIHQGR